MKTASLIIAVLVAATTVTGRRVGSRDPLWTWNVTAFMNPWPSVSRTTALSRTAFSLVSITDNNGMAPTNNVTAICQSLADGSIVWARDITNYFGPSHAGPCIPQCDEDMCVFAEYNLGTSWIALNARTGAILWSNQSNSGNWIWAAQLLPQGFLLFTDEGITLFNRADGTQIWFITHDAVDNGDGIWSGRVGFDASHFYYVTRHGGFLDWKAKVTKAHSATGATIWQKDLPYDIPITRDMMVTPDGSTFLLALVHTVTQRVHAFDTQSGAALWTTDALNYTGCQTYAAAEATYLMVDRGVLVGLTCTPNPAFPQPLSSDAFVTGVNVTTGATMWQHGYAMSNGNEDIPPGVGAGVAVVGFCASGKIEALDVTTGNTHWETAGGYFMSDETSYGTFGFSSHSNVFVGSIDTTGTNQVAIVAFAP